MEFDGGKRISSQVALLAPNTSRTRLIARDSDLIILDIPAHSADFRRLSPVFNGQALVFPSLDAVEPLARHFGELFSGTASLPLVEELYSETIAGLNPREQSVSPLDDRIERVLSLVQSRPMDQLSLETLAECACLSPSRLRHLFKAEMGFTLTQYVRWTSVWNAVDSWSRDRTLTEVATSSGFFDLPHFSRAFVEAFGLSPTDVFRPGNVRLVHLPRSLGSS
ncbi:helix-turn-helix transcriptional regulator [Proteobacteria bacterium 005FR1]|nr:helix-turn-helix transcriptional regulator [Proteobacteria bacterium 005FR1]